MTLDEVRRLVEYHYWARDRMFEALERLSPDQLTQDLGGSFRSVRDTVVHVYSAEWVWYSRWQGVSPTAMIAPETFADLASIRHAWQEHEHRMRAFFEGLDGRDVGRTIAYKSLAGHAGESALWQMVQHVVNHASYHRGQVTMMLRQLGVAPPKSMDLITYYREAGTGVV